MRIFTIAVEKAIEENEKAGISEDGLYVQKKGADKSHGT